MFENRKQITENLESYAYTITDIENPMEDLYELYKEIEEYTVDYGNIRGRQANGLAGSVENLGDRTYLDIPIIRELVDRFNPSAKEIGSGNICMVVYRPGFVFHPHIDFSRKASIMFPVYPSDAGAPIDFYKHEIVEGSKTRPHMDEYYIGSHFYSTKYPTITNSTIPHGVRNDTNDIRVQLQLSIYDDWNKCIRRIKTGRYINKKL